MPSTVSWLHVVAGLSILLVLANVYSSLFNIVPSMTTATTSTMIKEACANPKSSDKKPDLTDGNDALSWRQKVKANKLDSVVIFTCNEEYGMAVASSVVSVRVDGGYYGDIAVLMEEGIEKNNSYFTIPWMKDEILRQANNRTTSNSTTTTVGNNNTDGNRFFLNLDRIHIFSTQYLFDTLFSTSEVQQHYSYLQETPPVGECASRKRKRGHRGYFLKTLIYHPIIAQRWDVVLCKLIKRIPTGLIGLVLFLVTFCIFPVLSGFPF